MRALGEVPVFTRTHVEAAMNFLLSITELIIEMTAEKLDQLELTKSIKLSEAALLESQNQLKQNMHDLLESQKIAKFGTWRLEVATQNIVWSTELYRIFGLDPMLPPPSLQEQERFFAPESWRRLMNALEIMTTQGLPYELELVTIGDNGLKSWLWVSASASKDANGKVTIINGSAQDITERKMNEERLYFLSYHDHLTGLHNRRYFEEALIRLDCEEMLPLSIIMCDVNGLKLVNDSFGHSEGDELLKKAANIIKQVCREEDVVARVGGDEFIVMLTNTSNEETLKKSNEIKALASKESIANIELSISFGYDTKTHIEQSPIAVIANAENYMYRHKLYERSSLRSKNIDLILSALFEKSKREELHSTRVGNICKAIATKMNLDIVTINKLCVAGRVHDIGKIGVDENILNKSGSLDQREIKAVKNHPEIGWRLLSSTNEFSELSQFILNHHERWDGSGYPNGLMQNEIPIESRIIAIADAFDAMTRDRCYHKALTIEEASNELRRCAGTQFDPEIVNIFVNQVLDEDIKFSGD